MSGEGHSQQRRAWSRAERELIATYVSAQNGCRYFQTIHGAVAAHHLHGDEDLVAQVKRDFEHAILKLAAPAVLLSRWSHPAGSLRT